MVLLLNYLTGCTVEHKTHSRLLSFSKDLSGSKGANTLIVVKMDRMVRLCTFMHILQKALTLPRDLP